MRGASSPTTIATDGPGETSRGAWRLGGDHLQSSRPLHDASTGTFKWTRMRHFLGSARAVGILPGCMGPGSLGRTLVFRPSPPDNIAAGLEATAIEAIAIPTVARGADPHQLTTTGTRIETMAFLRQVAPRRRLDKDARILDPTRGRRSCGGFGDPGGPSPGLRLHGGRNDYSRSRTKEASVMRTTGRRRSGMIAQIAQIHADLHPRQHSRDWKSNPWR